MRSNVLRALASVAFCGAALLCGASSCTEALPLTGHDAGTSGLQVLNGEITLPDGSFCALPGSVVWTSAGPRAVAGATPGDLAWLTLPVGFCAHAFATVKTARQLRFAPGGDLFVASSRTTTTGGANNGVGGVVVLADDNHDGNADGNVTFLSGLPSVQGLMVTADHFYYQNGPVIQRIPFQDGQRQPAGPSEVVTDMSGTWVQDTLHWPKVLDTAQDGTIYITNGSSQTELCKSTRPVVGAIVRLNADGSTTGVARGFRNPIALRCEHDHDVCLAIELALDYSDGQGGREKVLVVHDGDDWGYPCCATQNLPYAGVSYQDTGTTPDCSGVAPESAAFVIGHTPFGIDFESGRWPAPWGGRAFVTLHGDYQSWTGARVVALALDPSTGVPLAASDLPGATTAATSLMDFATGWDDGRMDHGRPAPIAFAPDGRMFLGDDQLGAVIWIAPVGLTRQ